MDVKVNTKNMAELIKKYQESPYFFFKGKKIKKTLNQYIPYTTEKWEEYKRDKADRDNKQLINFIDKVFFEDGALN